MRVHFASDGDASTADTLRAAFAPVAERFGMRWRLEPHGAKRRVLIMVSKFGHCLNDLLFRARIGELPMDVVAVVSNHTDHQALVEWHGIPFFHVPVTADTKPAGGGAAAGTRGRARRGTRGAGPLHAGPQRRPHPKAGRAGHQHPPLVPAQLQGCQAVPPGLRPRREDRGRHRALRQRRARRGADHLAAGGGRGPHLRSRGPGGRRPRHRVQGASATPSAGTARAG